ncbi:MAG TPA: hypothetical protein DCQ36_11525 [Actinobacteria bacterium]|jgi:hypothetical protein|nr:hypothetical protein [Actinomycetota bacterium]
MLARSWIRGAGAISLGVLATAVVTAIVVAPAAQSDTALVQAVVEQAPVAQPARPAPSPAQMAAAARRMAAAEQASRASAARQAIAVRQAAFTRFTLHSPQTKDLRGIERSLYRGRFFRPVAEERRLCIVKRESEGYYDVVNPGGNYFGAYQVSRALAKGATYMMAKEHKALMGASEAKKVLADLRATPMHRWPRYWQDAAFHTIMNWERTMSGAAHWAGGRWHC